MNYMSSVSVTVRGDSFACVPSLVCRGRVTLLTCFACCAVSIYMQAGKADKQPPTHATGDTAHADSTVGCEMQTRL
jgi:hypothetical protein